MNKTQEALKLALEAICGSGDFLFNWHDCEPNNEREMQAYQATLAANEKAFKVIREALSANAPSVSTLAEQDEYGGEFIEVAECEKFCDNHCTWRDHHPDCYKAEQPAQTVNATGGPKAFFSLAEQPARKPVFIMGEYVGDGRVDSVSFGIPQGVWKQLAPEQEPVALLRRLGPKPWETSEAAHAQAKLILDFEEAYTSPPAIQVEQDEYGGEFVEVAEQPPCKYPHCPYPCPDLPDCRDAEQPAQQQEPFGIWHQGETEEESDFFLFKDSGDVSCPNCIKLYTSPQPSKPWVGLTDEDKEALEEWLGHTVSTQAFCAIEAKLRGKNHG